MINNKEEEKIMDKNMINDHEHSSDDQSKSKYRGWKVMPFVIGNETFEKLGTIGTVSNLLVYLTTVFNMSSITAATTLTIFSGTTNLATLGGAFLCDTYFGRFNTLCFGTIASFLGLVIIDLTAVIHKMHPSKCTTTKSLGLDSICLGPTPGQTAFLMAGFGLLIIGAGGIRPCNLAFGADQFDPKTESGKRSVNSFFNWYFFTFTFAKMVSLTLIVYVQSEINWALGLAIPPVLMFLSTAMFFVATKMYVKVKASGSPMTSVARVFVVSVKKRRLRMPEHPSGASLFAYLPPDSINSPLPYTRQFGFLNKAAIIRPEDEIKKDGSPMEPWSLCSIQQVEEAKCLVRVMPVWLSALVYHVAIVQQQTYVVFQALQSDRSLGSTNFEIPAATYIVFSMLSLTLFIPIYDRLVVPFLQRVRGREGGITLLQRIGIGILVSVVLSLLSGLVEDYRRTRPAIGLNPKRGGISSMSASWLIPQMALTGIAEAFAAIGQVEFYYKQFPENMRSIAGSLFFCGLAGSSYLSGFLITIVHRTTRESKSGNWLPEDLNHGRLDYFYYMVACLGAIDLVYFIVCAKWYKYKGSGEKAVELNQGPERQRV